MAIKDTVACGGVRLPEIRRPRCFTPLATGGLVHLRGEGDVRRLMLHSRFVEVWNPAIFRSITDSVEDCQSGEDYQSGKWFKWQVASGDWLQVRQEVTKRREGVGLGERGLRSDRQRGFGEDKELASVMEDCKWIGGRFGRLKHRISDRSGR